MENPLSNGAAHYHVSPIMIAYELSRVVTQYIPHVAALVEFSIEA